MNALEPFLPCSSICSKPRTLPIVMTGSCIADTSEAGLSRVSKMSPVVSIVCSKSPFRLRLWCSVQLQTCAVAVLKS